MRSIVSIFVKYPFYANIFIVVVLTVGTMSYMNMKKSFFPEAREREIFVSMIYPGASPKEMEEGITIRIEEAIRGIAGIKEINSTSSENFARVQITTTGEYKIDETLMEVKNAVDGITSFPVDAEKPVVFKQRAITSAVFLGLTGQADLMKLKRYADQIEYDFYASGIMSQIAITGYPPPEISVEVSEENLMRYNLTFDEISRAIAANNLDISGGQIRSENEEVLIRSRSRSVDPEQIAAIIIRANDDGTQLRIRDVGSVKMQFADVANISLMNGVQSISIRISKLPEEDLAAISKYVADYVADFNQRHNDAKLYVTFDFLDRLQGRLNLLYKNGGIGLALILIVLGMFLSVRLSFWVAFGIPASFLAMFIVAPFYGVTINMISLFGMILVVGILVDDGIVIAENIYAHFEQGKSAKQAAIDGTLEVFPAVFTSVFTTIIAFSPLFLIEGRLQFMYEMAFVVVFSLLFSLVEAFFVLPAHLGSDVVMQRHKRQNFSAKLRHILDRLLSLMRDNIYGKLLRFTIAWRYIMISIPVVLIILTFGLMSGGLIRLTFFPSIPFEQFNLDIAFTPGSGEKQTLEYLKRFEEQVWEVDRELMEELDDTNHFVDYTFLSLGSAFNGQETGSHAGNLFVLLRDLEYSGTSSFEIIRKVQEKIGTVNEAMKFSILGRNTFGTPVSLSLLGNNMDDLDAAKEMLLEGMHQIKALNNITDVNAAGMREIQLRLKPQAYFLGFTQASLTNQVRQGFFGGQAQRLQHGKDELRVWVRYPKSDRLNVGQLENMRIKTPTGEYPLSELADYDIERGPVNIKRFNGSREARIEADMVNPNEPVPPVIEQLRNEILPPIFKKYPNVRAVFQGQQRDSDEAGDQIGKYFSAAFALMLLIIIIHFKSFTQGLIVVLMIPLSWLGALWGHGIENQPVSILSAWGMIALSGVIINNAVIYLAKYNLYLEEGRSVAQAIFDAGMARFRPIVLTTITTSVGLYPIILEGSFQAQFLKPMAIALAYGVLIGTAFILIFFPALILVLNDTKRFFKWVINQIRLLIMSDYHREQLSAEKLASMKAVPSPESIEKAVIHSKRKIN